MSWVSQTSLDRYPRSCPRGSINRCLSLAARLGRKYDRPFHDRFNLCPSTAVLFAHLEARPELGSEGVKMSRLNLSHFGAFKAKYRQLECDPVSHSRIALVSGRLV